jgi:hypothetical protein
VIVPGQGPITDRRGVERLRDYWVALEAEARERHAAGLGPAEAARLFAISDSQHDDFPIRKIEDHPIVTDSVPESPDPRIGQFPRRCQRIRRQVPQPHQDPPPQRRIQAVEISPGSAGEDDVSHQADR